MMTDLNTVVTWIGPDGGDGEREARNLAGQYVKYCRVVPIDSLRGTQAFPLIVVGHASELMRLDNWHGEFFRNATSWLVLANCSSGVATYNGPLTDGNGTSPAQALANKLQIKVTGTTRPLTFDEVGQSTAFAISALYGIVLPTNYIGADGINQRLWQDYGPQSSLETLVEQFGRL